MDPGRRDGQSCLNQNETVTHEKPRVVASSVAQSRVSVSPLAPHSCHIQVPPTLCPRPTPQQPSVLRKKCFFPAAQVQGWGLARRGSRATLDLLLWLPAGCLAASPKGAGTQRNVSPGKGGSLLLLAPRQAPRTPSVPRSNCRTPGQMPLSQRSPWGPHGTPTCAHPGVLTTALATLGRALLSSKKK